MSELFSQILSWVEGHRSIWVGFSYFVLAVGLAQNLVYTLQLPFAALALRDMRRQDRVARAWWLSRSEVALPVSILIPAYNEELTICASVRTTLALEYPVFEAIVINDGSTDATLEKLIEEFDLKAVQVPYEYQVPCHEIRKTYKSEHYPNLTVIDKCNGGAKSDALNAGLNIARYPTFCTLDADSILEPSALLGAVQPFVDDPERMIAAGGVVRIINGCTVENGVVSKVAMPSKLLVRFQIAEYIRAFLMGRLAYSQLGILTIISGAFALIQRENAIAVGGFCTTNMGEDYDLILRMHRRLRSEGRDYRMEFIPEPVCWTEAPETLKVLKNQRVRWQQGALEGFFSNLSMFANPRYGRIGMLAFPLSFLFDVLGPLAEMSGWVLIPLLYAVGIVELDVLLAFAAMFMVFGVFISMISLLLEEFSLRRFERVGDLCSLAMVAVLENFGYRQLNSFWRVVGWWRFLRGGKSWGNMARIGANMGTQETAPRNLSE
ncbi:glycosyltransferase family 2 protein [Phycobacter sp. K97]|uniref:glycosyltransferase family 2 protein n=1 Tax=Phycobacter sedimenti TaxID=3133977 RepID=UPI00311E0D51